MAKSKKKDKPCLKVKEVQGSRLFGARLAGGSYKTGDYEFRYKALSAPISTYALQQSINKKGQVENAPLMFQYVKWGITAILECGKSLDYEKDTGEFINVKFEGLADSVLYSLPGELIIPLSNAIDAVSRLPESDKQSLDFTTASEKKTSGTDAPIVQSDSEKAES